MRSLTLLNAILLGLRFDQAVLIGSSGKPRRSNIWECLVSERLFPQA